MMRGIPNFKERGCGSVVLQSDMRDSIEELAEPMEVEVKNSGQT